MKRLLVVVLGIALGLTMIGCSGSNDSGSSPTTKAPEGGRLKKPEGVK